MWGPSPKKFHGKFSYFVTLIDDNSMKVCLYFLKTKDEVFGMFKEWKTIVEKRIGKKFKKLIIDNGLEFCNGPFEKFNKIEGILRHHTI